MRYKELKTFLNLLSNEQLEQEVVVIGEAFNGKMTNFWITEEDQVNPTGECLEPISVYDDDPDFDCCDVIYEKGTLLILVDNE